MALLWNAIKEAARAAKGQMSKNARNAAKAEAKKERGPVKAFFHITKNENVPAIEQQGLLTNHPNANINSANHPFRKHGTDAGGVWVTTEPTAFPVYGTTIGGKDGNAAARADALSTIKIEVPLPELSKMRAVEEPYGKNILRKGDDPRAIQKFSTWANIDVPSTVFLDDIKPSWLKNIGYVEENAPSYRLIDTYESPLYAVGGWDFIEGSPYRMLDKSRLRDASGLTGHHHNNPQDAAKSPYRFVDDYLDKNKPIANRLPEFPGQFSIEYMSRIQGAKNGPKHIWDPDNNSWSDVPALNERERYSTGFIPASEWSNYYRGYVKPGESINSKRSFEFAPGAISRGMGGRPSATEPVQAIYDRNFDWPLYKQMIASGETPSIAAHSASPDYVLDWDNITYHNIRGYGPKHIVINNLNEGAISRGNSRVENSRARMTRADRRKAAEIIRRTKSDERDYLSQGLGRQPTAEEVDNWARVEIFNKLLSGDMPGASLILDTWAHKYDENIVQQLSDELFKRMVNK